MLATALIIIPQSAMNIGTIHAVITIVASICTIITVINIRVIDKMIAVPSIWIVCYAIINGAVAAAITILVITASIDAELFLLLLVLLPTFIHNHTLWHTFSGKKKIIDTFPKLLMKVKQSEKELVSLLMKGAWYHNVVFFMQQVLQFYQAALAEQLKKQGSYELS